MKTSAGLWKRQYNHNIRFWETVYGELSHSLVPGSEFGPMASDTPFPWVTECRPLLISDIDEYIPSQVLMNANWPLWERNTRAHAHSRNPGKPVNAGTAKARTNTIGIISPSSPNKFWKPPITTAAIQITQPRGRGVTPPTVPPDGSIVMCQNVSNSTGNTIACTPHSTSWSSISRAHGWSL